MGSSKRRIGELIQIIDERNSSDSDYPFYGININKQFMPSAANTTNVDRTKYKVVRKQRFVFSGMQTGRDNCVRIGMYDEGDPILVSPAYTTFEVTSKEVIPQYLFMFFNSKEKDRYGAFLSDSSIRSNLDWDRFCDIEIDLPSIDVQRKFVAIYEGMLANKKVYEKGLSDLRIVCQGYIENLRRTLPCKKIGDYIELVDRRNAEGRLTAKDVKGIATSKVFIDSKANLQNVDLRKYKVVEKGEFAYVADTSRRGEKIGLAFQDDKPCLISSIYTVFRVKDKSKLLPRYLMMFFNRPEFDRYARFHSWGSARETFDFDSMKEVRIPIPDIAIQQNVVNVFLTIKKRKEFIERLSALSSSICPTLVQGATEAGK